MEPSKVIAEGEGSSLLPFRGTTINFTTARLLLARYEQLLNSDIAVSFDGIIEVDEHHSIGSTTKGEVFEIDEDDTVDRATQDAGADIKDERILGPSWERKVSCDGRHVPPSRSPSHKGKEVAIVKSSGWGKFGRWGAWSDVETDIPTADHRAPRFKTPSREEVPPSNHTTESNLPPTLTPPYRILTASNV